MEVNILKRNLIRRSTALLCAVFLSIGFVLVPCRPSYAADSSAIPLTDSLEYLIQMLSSAGGFSVGKSYVPVLWSVVEAQARVNDPDFLEDTRTELESFQERFGFGVDYSNKLFDKLFGVLGSDSLVQEDTGGWSVSVMVPGEVMPITENGKYLFGSTSFTLTGVKSPVYGYCFHVVSSSDLFFYSIRLVSLDSFSYGASASAKKVGDYYMGGSTSRSSQAGLDSVIASGYAISLPDMTEAEFETLLKSDNFVLGDVPSKAVTVPLDHVWIDAYDDAALHAPAITAPISVPTDAFEREENLKAVASAENADALYKALAGAGIALNPDVSIPDESESVGDITGDDTVAIGKSLSDILTALSGLGEKIAAIPNAILAGVKDLLISLFVPSSDFFPNEVDSLLNALKAVLPYQDYIDVLGKIQSFSSGELEDIKVNVSGPRIVESGGDEVTAVSFAGLRKSLPTYHKWVRGLFLVLLVIFNVNQLYKLIRGVSLFAGGKDGE